MGNLEISESSITWRKKIIKPTDCTPNCNSQQRSSPDAHFRHQQAGAEQGGMGCIQIFLSRHIYIYIYLFSFLTHLRMLTIIISGNCTCLALLLFVGLKTEHSCTEQLVIQESLDFHYKLLPLWPHQPLYSYLASFMIL